MMGKDQKVNDSNIPLELNKVDKNSNAITTITTAIITTTATT
jgi:hypothetical protein